MNPGHYGLPVVVGCIAVAPGDIVRGDETAWSGTSSADLKPTIARLMRVRAAEADLNAN